MIPLRRESFRRELIAMVEWYNEYRPHMALGGKTPTKSTKDVLCQPQAENRTTAGLATRIALRQTVGAGWRRTWELSDTTVHFEQKRPNLSVVMLRRTA